MQRSISLFHFFLLVVSVLFYACSTQEKEASDELSLDGWLIRTLDTFPINSSIRALTALDDQTVWFAGSGGIFGYTENGGRTWTIDSIRTDTIVPHFRAIAVTDSAVHLLCVASPALLYRSTDKGKNWEIVYREEHPAAFYDAMKFWDDQYGVAMGDPTDGCLSIIRTTDGGRNWTKVSCDNIPPVAEGEAAFAASNSNIALAGDQAWIVSGGARARVYHSSDKGKSWSVFDTPIVQGGQMTGIYSVDFYSEKQGIIFGGDWNNKALNSKNKAVTTDGGKNWELIADGKAPGYRSQVRYIPGTEGRGLLACGIPGISYSSDGGENWEDISNEAFYTFDFGSNPSVIWLAGNKRIARLSF